MFKTYFSCLWLYFLSPTFLVTLPVNFPEFIVSSLKLKVVGLTLRLFLPMELMVVSTVKRLSEG